MSAVYGLYPNPAAAQRADAGADIASADRIKNVIHAVWFDTAHKNI